MCIDINYNTVLLAAKSGWYNKRGGGIATYAVYSAAEVIVSTFLFCSCFNSALMLDIVVSYLTSLLILNDELAVDSRMWLS